MTPWPSPTSKLPGTRRPADSCSPRKCRAIMVPLAMVATLLAAFPVGAQNPPDLPDRDLLRDLPRGKPGASASRSAQESPQGTPKLDARTGEDLGEAPGMSEWRTIHSWMTQAAQRLAAGETAASTQQLQQQILDRLAQLGQTGTQQRPSTSAGTQRRQKPGRGDSKRDGPQQAATQASPPETEPLRTSLSLREAADAATQVWGELPPKLQQQLRAAGRIEFLPGYRRQIQQYYRKLSQPSQLP